MNNEKDGLFRTSDFGFIAVLLYFGYETIEVDRSDPHRANFIFKFEKHLLDLQDDYQASRLKVDPFHFNVCLKGVKSRLLNWQEVS